MGDMIELTTWPNPENVFYEVSSSALTFYVKASRTAVIGLARKHGHTCEYWVVISNNPYSFIKKGNEPRTKIRTPGILNPEVYQKFWIAWNGSLIRLGNGDENSALITCQKKVPGLKYITFDIRSRREATPIQWKFEMPPQLSKPMILPLAGGEPQWVRVSNKLPENAVIGGHKNEVLYIIRASHMGSFTPGYFTPSLRLATISWGSSAHEKLNFEVLCGYNFTWVPCWDDRIPVNAVVGGYAEGDSREKLYIGRVAMEGHVIPGKVQPSHRVCYIPYNNREVPQTFYEILVMPDVPTRTVSKVFLYDMECDTGSESDNDEEQIEPDWG